jgi:hypothetical protein
MQVTNFSFYNHSSEFENLVQKFNDRVQHKSRFCHVIYTFVNQHFES